MLLLFLSLVGLIVIVVGVVGGGWAFIVIVFLSVHLFGNFSSVGS